VSRLADSLIAKRTCSIDGCEKPHYARDWCRMHYTRWQRHGRTELHLRPSEEERFWTKVDMEGPIPATFWDPVERGHRYQPDCGRCWLWCAGTNGSGGYGRFRTRNVMFGAHRYSYELCYGTVPEGQVIDHLCRITACVNPSHLEAVSFIENLERGDTYTDTRSMTHCKHGHPFNEENTYRPPSQPTKRMCRECLLFRNRWRYRNEHNVDPRNYRDGRARPTKGQT
jgi:hypothetical protein